MRFLKNQGDLDQEFRNKFNLANKDELIRKEQEIKVQEEKRKAKLLNASTVKDANLANADDDMKSIKDKIEAESEDKDE